MGAVHSDELLLCFLFNRNKFPLKLNSVSIFPLKFELKIEEKQGKENEGFKEVSKKKCVNTGFERSLNII